MTKPMLPGVQAFIDQVRELCGTQMDEEARWLAAADALKVLLADPALHANAKQWPISPAKLGLEGKHANLLFYEDPDYGFVINGLIKRPSAKTTVHDHGKSWTLYGVLDGAETVARFERKDGGLPGDLPKRAPVESTADSEVTTGHVDCIGPWDIHAEYNGEERTVAVIVRSQKSGTFVQNIFHELGDRVEQYDGPEQIPYHLG